MTTNTDVYTTDLYAWCLTTAALVRAGQWDAIDAEALAEELESLGKSQQRELKSRLEVLVLHLLKWQHQPQRRQEGHSWEDTILEQRHQIADLLGDNPSLRPQVGALLAAVYPRACQRALRQMTPSGGETHQRPVPLPGFVMPQGGHQDVVNTFALGFACPWTEHDILDDDFWPGP